VHISLLKRILVTAVIFLSNLSPCNAYSVLTHEAIIDVNWEKLLIPLLKQKYPNASADALKEAHAYAYGGAVAPDLGYYPFGSRLFTNLIHYVRSGDFVEALLADAQDLNEYAFALGALCHYHADKYGHSVGINECVPILYPKMKRKFGDTVTYADNHISHVRTEFAFDVLQTARGNYASTAYHDFIGFKVSRSLLERAFLETYGLDVNDLFGNFSKAIGRFRWTVINIFPVLTKSAWQTKKQAIQETTPQATGRNFIYRMQRKNYIHQFDKEDKKPGFFAQLLSVLIILAPKIGPLRALKFESPGPEAEKLFIYSFDTTVFYYSQAVGQLRNGTLALKNIDFDSGKDTSPGEYKPADKCYMELLLKLRDKNFETVTAPLQQNILSFYSQYKTKPVDRKDALQWQKMMEALEQLKGIHPVK
jgi:hypothetical protein